MITLGPGYVLKKERDRPLALSMVPTGGAGVVVTNDETSVYFDPDSWQPAWERVGRLLDPRLNVPPEGNC